MQDEGPQNFHYTVVPFEGGWQEADLHHRADRLNRKLAAIPETYHEGPLRGSFSGLKIEGDNVSLSAVKPAEDGTGTVLRLYENAGRAAEAKIVFPLCDREFSVRLTPYEMETYFIPADPDEEVRIVYLTEPLP